MSGVVQAESSAGEDSVEWRLSSAFPPANETSGGSPYDRNEDGVRTIGTPVGLTPWNVQLVYSGIGVLVVARTDPQAGQSGDFNAVSSSRSIPQWTQ